MQRYSRGILGTGSALASGRCARRRIGGTGNRRRRACAVRIGRRAFTPADRLGRILRRNAPECSSAPVVPRDVVLTTKAWKDLVRVNRWVNETIRPMTDIEHWGVVEKWSYPDDGYGDCEDYVLLKRRLLMQAGWPRSALLITVVRDKKGEGHAVLTVKTDKGEFVLDNQDEDILLWSDTGYRFVKRQSQSNQNIWVDLDDPRPATATATSR